MPDRRLKLVAEPHPERRMRRRLDQISSELGLDRERVRGWGIAHALGWGPNEALVECARLLAEAR